MPSRIQWIANMVAKRMVVLGACAVVVICATASQAARVGDIVIGRKSASGRHAQAVPSADAGRYRRISVRVNAVPNQRVTGSWTVVCHVGGTGTSRGAEDFKGRTPLTVAVRPGALDYGWVCTVVGAATLAGRGRITVELVAHT